MSDPIRDLDDFDPQGLLVTPLPASEVRRRGDRLRRRNRALAGVGAAAAVLVVITPLAMFADRGERAEGPSDTPTVPAAGWLTTIPEEFPLTTGLPSGTAPRGGPVRMTSTSAIERLSFCGRVAWSPTGPYLVEDVAGTVYTRTPTEVRGGRTLALYQDAAKATTALELIRADATSCPSQEQNSFLGTSLARDVTAGGSGEESVVVTEQVLAKSGVPTGETFGSVVVRVGNALLLTTAGSPARQAVTANALVSAVSEQDVAVVDSMCVFSLEGCSSSPDPTTPSRATAIPADFPLDDGWPQGGETVEAPSGDNEPVRLTPRCGTDASYAHDPVDRLTARWGQPEDSRERELLTFRDDAEAADVSAGLEAYYGGCPEENADGATYLTQVDADGLAPGSWQASTSQTQRGQLTPYQSVVEVTSVGNAVLISTGNGEGTSAAGMVEDLAGPVAALCVFSDQGCGSAPSGPTSSGNTAIPADFPLGVDLPDYTGDGGVITDPAVDAVGVEGSLCGTDAWSASQIGRLAAGSTGPEYDERRELRVFADADGAVAEMGRLRTALAGCPRDTSRGAERVVRSYPADTGYDDTATFAVTARTGLGGTIFQFTRVGRAVLAISIGGETSTASAVQSVPDLTALTRRLTPSMCLFTQAGC